MVGDYKAPVDAVRTIEKQQETGIEDLIEFSPSNKDTRRSDFSLGRPPEYCNNRNSERSEKDNVHGSDENGTKSFVDNALLDESIDEPGQENAALEQEERVQVTLKRKRKGKKGRSSTYDLTPFLSY